jgi:hypothetical protein
MNATRQDGLRIASDVQLGRAVKRHAFVNLYGGKIIDDSKIGAFVAIHEGSPAAGGREF